MAAHQGSVDKTMSNGGNVDNMMSSVERDRNY